MSTVSAVNEHKRLQAVERRYKRRGYRVLLEPQGDDLPPFLSRFKPDMLAFNDQESVVVEVKPRAALPESRYLTALAEAVDAQQGWRLDLAVVNPKNRPLIDEDVETLGQPEIVSRIQAVRQLMEGRQEDAAILLAWSTTEAALRLLAGQHRIAIPRDQPDPIIKQLYSLGILSRDDYETLQQGLRARNIIVHGFRLPESEPRLTAALISMVEEILQTSVTHLAM